MLTGLKQLDGISFVARIMVEPATSAQYKDANKLANVVTPDEPQYAALLRGEAVPPEPVNARPRKVEAAVATPAWATPTSAAPEAAAAPWAGGNAAPAATPPAAAAPAPSGTPALICRQHADRPEGRTIISAVQGAVGIVGTVANVSANIVLLPNVVFAFRWPQHFDQEIAGVGPARAMNQQCLQQTCALRTRDGTEVRIGGLEGLMRARPRSTGRFQRALRSSETTVSGAARAGSWRDAQSHGGLGPWRNRHAPARPGADRTSTGSHLSPSSDVGQAALRELSLL